MKKKRSLILALSMCFCLSGCKGDTGDVSKQLNKMDEFMHDKDFSSLDYEIEGEFTTRNKNDNTVLSMEYVLEKDGDNYYIEIETERNESEYLKQYWLIRNDTKYDIYFNNNGEKQFTSIINDRDELNYKLYAIFLEENIMLEPNLLSTYNNIKNNIESSINSCNENIEGYSCKVEKKLFSKVTLNITYSYNNLTTSSIYKLKRGKIKEISTTKSSAISSIYSKVEFDYDNQKITIPNKSDYSK